MILLIWLNYWYCVKLFRIIVVFFFLANFAVFITVTLLLYVAFYLHKNKRGLSDG